MPLSVRAIAAGTAIAALGSVLLGALYFVFLFSMFPAQNAAPGNVALDASDFASIVLLGLLSTSIGGYVAGRLARRRQIVHGAIVGVASLCVWLLFDAANPGAGAGTWTDMAAYVGEIPLGALGGYLALRASMRASNTRTPS